MASVAPVPANNYGRISAAQIEHSNYKDVGAPPRSSANSSVYSELQLRKGDYGELQLRPPGTDYADASALAGDDRGSAAVSTQYADASALAQ